MPIYNQLNNFFARMYKEVCEDPMCWGENTIIRCAGAADFVGSITEGEEHEAIVELWDKVWRPQFLGKIGRWDLI